MHKQTELKFYYAYNKKTKERSSLFQVCDIRLIYCKNKKDYKYVYGDMVVYKKNIGDIDIIENKI